MASSWKLKLRRIGTEAWDELEWDFSSLEVLEVTKKVLLQVEGFDTLTDPIHDRIDIELIHVVEEDD